MSKNYYLVRKNNRKSQEIVMNHLEKYEFDDVHRVIKEMNEGIHLYQIACGWKVAIEYHPIEKYYDKTIESFLEFIDNSLKSDDWVLRDEYGVEFPDISEVVNDIEGFSSGMTGAESDENYYKKYGHYPILRATDHEEVVDNKVRFISCEFC